MLERLLSLERRLEAAYEAALRQGALDEQLALSLREQEREHVRGLEQLLVGRGRAGAAAPRDDPRLARAVGTPQAFARYALALEGRAVEAYVEVAARLGEDELLEALGAMMTSEAQHRVALRQALRGPLLGGVA
jgi:rubrerythrin